MLTLQLENVLLLSYVALLIFVVASKKSLPNNKAAFCILSYFDLFILLFSPIIMIFNVEDYSLIRSRQIVTFKKYIII